MRTQGTLEAGGSIPLLRSICSYRCPHRTAHCPCKPAVPSIENGPGRFNSLTDPELREWPDFCSANFSRSPRRPALSTSRTFTALCILSCSRSFAMKTTSWVKRPSSRVSCRMWQQQVPAAPFAGAKAKLAALVHLGPRH